MGKTKVVATYPTTKIAKPARPSYRKGGQSERTKLCKSIIAEVAGLMPYEKRLLDMIKTAGTSSEKRMYKYAKQRLGTHKRALKKREGMKDIYAAMRARQAMEK